MNTLYVWLICWAVGLITYIALSFRKKSKKDNSINTPKEIGTDILSKDTNSLLNFLTDDDIPIMLGSGCRYEEDTKTFYFNSYESALHSLAYSEEYLPIQLKIPLSVENVKIRFQTFKPYQHSFFIRNVKTNQGEKVDNKANWTYQGW